LVESAKLKELRAEVMRREHALADARGEAEADNSLSRRKVRRAEDLLLVAQGELRRLVERGNAQSERIAAEERRRLQRAPPDLQGLVEEHGGYDKITNEVWRRFDADMAEWQAKTRNGEFP
jgi:hypothetical protein